MFEQAAIAVQDEQKYAELHTLIDAAFEASDVEVFLDRVIRFKLRIRDFEAVISRGLLGKEAVALYKALPVSDQALTRERYLRLVERGAGGVAATIFEGVRVLLRYELSAVSFQLSVDATDFSATELKTEN